MTATTTTFNLYVVMTNLPGPGAAAHVREAAGAMRIGGNVVDALVAAADRGCEFVELEDAEGNGVGSSSGIDWDERPASDSTWGKAKTFHRLGPFVAAKDYDEMQGALEEARALLETGERDGYVSEGWREDARRWASCWAAVLAGA